MEKEKFFKCGLNLFKVFFVIILMIEVSGCNEISHGDQRRKFEFLYKMNNYATLFREYTGVISYKKDFELYKKRMNKLYLDVDAVKIIPGYEPSVFLKSKFIKIIDDNLMIIQTYEQTPGLDSLNINEEYQIRHMKENVDMFFDLLNDEISKVGKE